MERMRGNREKGQALIMVALMVVVLFGFVALALDMGNVYGGRRRMQNAADAGALAGAREICFGGHDSLAAAHTAAISAAYEYAEDRNGSLRPQVEIVGDYTVTVVTSQTLDTFFAGVIGIQTADVRAEAAAMCGNPASGGGMFPLAFQFDVYSDSIPCGTEFMVFDGKDLDQLDCAQSCKENKCPDGCDCTSSDPGDGCEGLADCSMLGPHITQSQRGWADLCDPGDPYPTYGCNLNGVLDRLRCWILHGYSAPIGAGICVPGEDGQMDTLRKEVNDRAQSDPYTNIILWDHRCKEGDDPEPICDPNANKSYFVADFGCVKLRQPEAYDKKYDLRLPCCGDPTSTCVAGTNLKVIFATKICKGDEGYDECVSASGSTGGRLPRDWEVRAVSLVK